MGTLYVVGTPIGNLEDMGQRALRILREVALVAAEDTRVTRQLLARFDLQTPLVSFSDAYDRRKGLRLERVLSTLEAGQDVALVSDAGMPGISDPGYELIRQALAAQHPVVVIPGPSAVLAALLSSGLPTDRFLFLGFLPRKGSARRRLMSQVADEPGSLVAFEAPHRLQETLADLLAILGDRQVAVARELTKLHEEVWRGSLSGAQSSFADRSVRGEITLVVAGTGREPVAGWSSAQIREAVELLQAEGLAPAAVARVVGRLSGWHRSDVYRLLT